MSGGERGEAGSGRSAPGAGRPFELPVLGATTPLVPRGARPAPAPKIVPRGVVLFDLDGTLLDDLALIASVAADVMHHAFDTPPEEARIHYLATTGMPFEAQLAQLYPDAPAPVRAGVARTFHQRKVTEAYARAKPYPEVPKLLKRLASDHWTLAVTTGAETEMADLLLEREGLRYWFEDVLGSSDGTKREHLVEYRRRYPERPMFLVGDSRFDMEAATSADGVIALGRASMLGTWTLTPADLRKWGAAWADYSLAKLPEVLSRLKVPHGARARARSGSGPGTERRAGRA